MTTEGNSDGRPDDLLTIESRWEDLFTTSKRLCSDTMEEHAKNLETNAISITAARFEDPERRIDEIPYYSDPRPNTRETLTKLLGRKMFVRMLHVYSVLTLHTITELIFNSLRIVLDL